MFPYLHVVQHNNAASIICMHYITVAVGKHGRHVMAEFLCVVLSKLKVKYSFIYTHMVM